MFNLTKVKTVLHFIDICVYSKLVYIHKIGLIYFSFTQVKNKIKKFLELYQFLISLVYMYTYSYVLLVFEFKLHVFDDY